MAKKLHFASDKERAAIDWVKSQYGRDWRKRICETVSESERSFPYPALKHCCARPFGFKEWNVIMAYARNCYRRNFHFPLISKEMAA